MRPFDSFDKLRNRRLRDLGCYDIPDDNSNAKDNIKAEANMADKAGYLADVVVIVPQIGNEAELRGHKHREHVDQHHEVEALAVQRLHA